MGEGPVTAAIISAHEIVHTGLEGMFATRPGAVEVIPRTTEWGGLNAALHAND